MKRFLFFVPLLFAFSSHALEVYLPGIMGGIDFCVDLPWNESVFSTQDSFSYNHDFAALSCALSLAAYTDRKDSEKSDFLFDMYRAMGFGEESLEFFYDVDYSDDYGNDQSAFSFASKKFGEKSVVVIAIRGTPEGAEEWISNTNIADSVFDEKGNQIKPFPEEHEGFLKAVRQIMSKLDFYMLHNNLSYGDCVFWITGHSRGAAEANLLAVHLKNERGANAKNILAYTFASPNVTRDKNAQTDEYGYIWNIVNEEDIVPSVPFESGDWGYRKYGHTLAFSNSFTAKDYADFMENKLPKMSARFEEFFGRRYYPFGSGNYVPYILGEILQAINKDPESYYSTFGLHNPLSKILAKSFSPKDEEKPSKHSLLQKFIERENPNLIENAQYAANDMHTAATYLAWLLSEDEKSLYDASFSYIIRFRGKAEMQIKNEDGDVLARAVNGAGVIGFGNGKLPVITSLSGVVYAGAGGNQNLTVEITKDSLLPTKTSFEIEEFSPSGSSEGVLSFSEIRPSLFKKYTLFLTADKSALSERFADDTSFDATLSAWKASASPFCVRPILFIDSAGFLSAGLTAGNKKAFASLSAGANITKSLSSAQIASSLTLQTPLKGALYTGISGGWKWVFESEEKVSNVPFAELIFSLQPRKRVQFFASAGADFNIEGFNDNAFSDSARALNDFFKPIRLSSSVCASPVFRLGIKF